MSMAGGQHHKRGGGVGTYGGVGVSREKRRRVLKLVKNDELDRG